jgi:predicted nucleotide-binding protein (sugar kinase/HSP70/actin superfamily)
LADNVKDARIQEAIADFGMAGRRLYLPQMPYGGTYLLAAAIRSIGFDAWPTSDSDELTLELGGRVTSGDECYPQKIVLGDFLRIIEAEGRDNVAFLMPSANGPCRFGQYLHLIRAKFDELGYDDIPVISITSSDGYTSIGNYSQDLVRTAWRAVLAQDILMKLLLKTRPYELEKGSTDAVYQQSLEEVGEAVSLNGVSHKERLAAIVPAVQRARDRFRAIPAAYDRSRPLIGVVGEIFCRQNTFSNFDLIRVVEEQGGE